MSTLPYELDPTQSYCPVCAAIVGSLDFHLAAAHPATSPDVAPTEEEANS